MFKRSQRTATKIGDDLSLSADLPTIQDFLTLLSTRRLDRAVIESQFDYCSNCLNDSGSQFTVYTDDGIRNENRPAVVKVAKFRMAKKRGTIVSSSRRQIQFLKNEILVLTNARLKQHPNIIELLLYDFIVDGDQGAIPVLIVERADHNSLEVFLRQEHSLTDTERLHLCADFTAGLAALHDAEVIHGDIKPDNILVFASRISNTRFQAKLSDFGSIISFASASSAQESRVKRLYFGTPLYNAPEVEDLHLHSQSARSVRSYLCCDAYSLGLSIYQTLNGDLEQELSRKDSSVLLYALQKAQVSENQPHVIAAYSQVFDQLLRHNPSERCSDMQEIWTLLHYALVAVNGKDRNIHLLSADTNVGRIDSDIAKNIETVFGSSSYLDYGWDDEIAIPETVQCEIFNDLLATTRSKTRSEIGRAYFIMALALAIGLGSQINVEKAIEAMLLAARAGYKPAYALFWAWQSATNCKIEVDEDTQLDWLYEATALGSFFAGDALQKRDSGEYKLARQEFHSAGGYNQYFRETAARGLAHSTYIINLVSSKSSVEKFESPEAAAFSAAAFGDTPLLTLLIQKGLDPDLTNDHGESLLVVACKAGHLAIVETLVRAGASACVDNVDGRRIRESTIYWLVAFDSCDVRRAAQLLFEAGAGSTGVEYVTWNHPSIDFPGYFPRACPLHAAIWFNDCEVIRQLCLHWPHHVNAVAPDEHMTPLRYALRNYRLEPARILIENGALTNPSVNEGCLFDIGSALNHEALFAQSLYLAYGDKIVIECIELVRKHAPQLLDKPGEMGFTLLMEAAQYHNTKVIKHLLSVGCSASLETPPEFDGRTALNILTENKLKYVPDDIIELLLNAGADLHHKSVGGGKTLLHFAARDDILWIAERCLDLGLDIESRACLGETPLHTAALYGSANVGRLLISRGANVEAKHDRGTINRYDWRGLTPLAFAASSFQENFVKMLLEHRGSVMARPDTKSTLLHMAAGEPDTKLLKLLLDIPTFQTPEVLNAKDTIHGATALHYCVDNFGKEEHAQLLIEAGADINALTSQGYSVLDIVSEGRIFLKDKFDRLLSSVQNFNEERDDGDETMPTWEEYQDDDPEFREILDKAEAIKASMQPEEWQHKANKVGEESLKEVYNFGDYHHETDVLHSFRAHNNLEKLLEASGARLNNPDQIGSIQYGILNF